MIQRTRRKTVFVCLCHVAAKGIKGIGAGFSQGGEIGRRKEMARMFGGNPAYHFIDSRTPERNGVFGDGEGFPLTNGITCRDLPTVVACSKENCGNEGVSVYRFGQKRCSVGIFYSDCVGNGMVGILGKRQPDKSRRVFVYCHAACGIRENLPMILTFLCKFMCIVEHVVLCNV